MSYPKQHEGWRRNIVDVQVLVLAVVVVALAFSAILIRRGRHHEGTLDRHGLDGLQRIYGAEQAPGPIPVDESPGARVPSVRLVIERTGLEGR